MEVGFDGKYCNEHPVTHMPYTLLIWVTFNYDTIYPLVGFKYMQVA